MAFAWKNTSTYPPKNLYSKQRIVDIQEVENSIIQYGSLNAFLSLRAKSEAIAASVCHIIFPTVLS